MPLSVPIPEPVTEVLHGVTVVDPYRWLEDRRSLSTEQWISDQQQRRDSYFAGIADLDLVRSRVRQYLNIDVLDQVAKVGDKLFFRLRKKDQEQACIYVKDLDTDHEEVLVDPSSLGAFASVAMHRISQDGSLLAYELKQGGSDTKEIYIVASASKQTLLDHLPIGYARGFAFAPDGAGFYYCHEDISTFGDHTIRFHRFGASSEDLILYRRAHTSQSRLTLVSDDVHLGAVYTHSVGTEFAVDFHLARHDRTSAWAQVFIDKAFPCAPLLHCGRIFVLTEENARNGNVIELAKSGAEIKVVVPESESPIEQIACARGAFYIRYLINRKNVVRSWTANGNFSGIASVPPEGTVRILPSLTDNSNSLFYSFESFTEPLRIKELNLNPGMSDVSVGASTSIDLTSYRIHEVWYYSDDGTKIPMSLVMRPDFDPEESHPAILTGYGGFGVSMTPKFSTLVTILLEFGAVFALPNIRGGSEFGKEWHEAAQGRRRYIAIQDFIAAAEWISRWGVRTPRALGIFGGSNSGLLVASAMTQRPDLFRAVLCIAPLLDMLRYECFDQARKWRREFGSIADPEDFAALLSYSPYQRVLEHIDYPATLFVAGDRDDRCNPAHVRKMAARLQHRAAQKNPVLVDYSAERGHSPVLPLSMRIEALARRVAFLCKELDIPLRVEVPNETTCD